MTLKKKIFILDTMSEDDFKLGFESVAKKLEIPVEVRISENYPKHHIPNDFDIYVLHLSEIDEEKVKELKLRQPWSYFVGSTGAGESQLPRSLLDLFDDTVYVPDRRSLGYILQKTWMDKKA